METDPAPWLPCFLTDQNHFSFFVEGYLETKSTKLVGILTTGFRGKYLQSFFCYHDKPIPLVAMFLTDQISLS